jgi:pectin methylesterase-like acyl-CoA thioesterase
MRRSLFIVAVVLMCANGGYGDVLLKVGPGEQFADVQSAVDAVPANNTVRHVIEITPGTYQKRVIVPDNKPFITLRGTGNTAADTKLTYFETATTPPNESTVHASTVIRAKDFIAENLTFENTAGQSAGQALAIYVRGDRAIFNNCRFLGWQDTLRSESGRHYFYNSYVEGHVDFIYGKGTAYFENSTLFAKAGGYLTAQGRETAAETNGYVFKNSTITGSASNGSVYLGRPWQAYSRSIFIDTKMSSIINPAGWQTWSGNNHLTSFFAEYNSTDLNGNPINMSNRVAWSKQLTAQQAAAYTKELWLAGNDGWNPVITEPADPSADFDGDGDVDGRDFIVWQRGFGLGDQTDNSLGDANFDGDINELDLIVWQEQFGESTPEVTAVPEPGALVIVGAMIALSAFHRAPAR